MGWLFVIVSISWARLRQRPDSLDQGPAQLLEIRDLRLLVRQRVVQRGQQLLLMGQLGLDIDYFLFIHRCHQVVAGKQTLRRRTQFFNPAALQQLRQAPGNVYPCRFGRSNAL